MREQICKICLILIFLNFLSVGKISAYFNDQGEISENIVSTACWSAPNPVDLESPENNSILSLDDIGFSWQPAASSCPEAAISYKLQIFTDSALTNLYYSSEWILSVAYVLNNMDEGQYWWQVEAKDQYGNEVVSGVYRLTIDRTPPTATLSVTGSWTKSVEEKIENGDFENGTLDGWTINGNVELVSSDDVEGQTVNPYEGNYMVKIGKTNDSGNWLWENRLMASVNSGVKSFSLWYNLFSRDYTPYDDPLFLVRLNGQEVFKQNTLAVNPTDSHDEIIRNSGWQEFIYDLSDFSDSRINIGIYAGNTGDELKQSWAYIDKITTYLVAAPAQVEYKILGSDTVSGIDRYEYKIDDSEWQEGESFNIPDEGTHNLQYRVSDKGGNWSPIHLVKVITDSTAPSQIIDIEVSATENKAELSWTSTGNDGSIGRATLYDVRFQKNCSELESFNFDTAAKVDKVPAPQESGKIETLEIVGLNPDTSYCFGLKSADEAPNWSDLSNVATTTTLTGNDANFGDVVINELMWAGSSVSSSDQWIELRNTTDRSVTLGNWKFTKDEGLGEVAMYVFPESASIAPYGYLLISEYDAQYSSLKNSPDLVVGDGSTDDPTFSLSSDHLDIKLYEASNNLIDVAGDGSAPFEGISDTTNGRYYSMERISLPSNGTNPFEWYTTIDEASSLELFDGLSDQRGTPKVANRSENEPLAHVKLIERREPDITLLVSVDRREVSFKLVLFGSYETLSYELIYDTDSGAQGVAGEVRLDDQSIFEKNDIVLGTCSAGGTCVYYDGVKNIRLKISLINPPAGGQTFSFEKKYSE